MEANQNEPKKEKMNALVIIASIISSLGGILFGYDIGIISSAMIQISDQFGLDNTMTEVVTSSVLLGAFLSSLVAGSVVDYFGRRLSILLTSLLFLAGTAILVFGGYLSTILIGRLIVGFGVALSTAAECTYISEISPPRWRGLLVSLNEFGITIGFLLAYVFGYIFIQFHSGWRYMFAVAAIPAVAQLIGVAFLPPSPHFLILKGKTEQAALVIGRLSKGTDAQAVIEQISTALEQSKSTKFRDVFGSADGMRYRMVIGTALVLLQQFTGNSNILYYAPIIFQQLGYCSNKASTLVSVSLGVIKVVTAAVALTLVDRLGRKKFLCTGSALMGVSILILGIVNSVVKYVPPPKDTSFVTIGSEVVVNKPHAEIPFHNASSCNNCSEGYEPDLSYYVYDAAGKPDNNNNSLENGTMGNGTCEGEEEPMVVKVVSVVALMAYICGYQFSFGIGTWLVLSEIYPTAIRGRSVSIATSVYWASNIIITITFLTCMEKMGISALFIIYACICLFATVFIFLFIPETKQKSLEEISKVMNAGPQIMWKRRSKKYVVFGKSEMVTPSVPSNQPTIHQNGDATL